jgi:hypothetical protein
MYPSYHIGFGALFALALYFIFPSIGILGGLLIFLSSIFADIDHYLVYVKRKGNFSLKKAYIYFVNYEKSKEIKKEVHPLFIFHTVEFVALLIIFSFFINFFFYIALGLLFHMILDFIELKKLNQVDLRCFSITECYFKKKH